MFIYYFLCLRLDVFFPPNFGKFCHYIFKYCIFFTLLSFLLLLLILLLLLLLLFQLQLNVSFFVFFYNLFIFYPFVSPCIMQVFYLAFSSSSLILSFVYNLLFGQFNKFLIFLIIFLFLQFAVCL